MAWWKLFGGDNEHGQQQQQISSDEPADFSPKHQQSPSGAVQSTFHAVQDAATVASDTAVGAEQREAVKMENREIWGRIKEGDTLWGLSEKYLGDPTKWPHLHAACKKEVGPDPLRLLPGTHLTEACVARARETSRRGR